MLKAGNIKFVKNSLANNAKDPLETMTPGRVYVTINDKEQISSINYYQDGKRVKSINLLHSHKGEVGPHVHLGYYHEENGWGKLTAKEKRLVAFVQRVWYDKHASGSIG